MAYYIYANKPVEETYNKFFYEVDLYQVYPNRANLLIDRYYISDTLLEVKESEVVRQFKNFKIIRFITLLGVPKSFIEDNQLKLYEPKKKNKNAKRKSTNPA